MEREITDYLIDPVAETLTPVYKEVKKKTISVEYARYKLKRGYDMANVFEEIDFNKLCKDGWTFVSENNNELILKRYGEEQDDTI